MSRWSTKFGPRNNKLLSQVLSPRRGQVLVLFAFGFVGLVACVGMAVDMGLLMSTRRNYQKIADTCATVGAQTVPIGGGTDRARTCVVTNNIPDGTSVNNPPGTGLYTGNAKFLEVRIERNVPTLFMRAVGIQTVPVGVRAVASAYRKLDYGIMGLASSGNAVRSAGGASSQINANVCSHDDFQVSGTMNVNGTAVANGEFNGTPNATDGLQGGLTSDPCLDPAYPLPSPSPVAVPAVGGGPIVNIDTALLCSAVPPAPRIRISCPVGMTVIVAPPRQEVDIRGSNHATVELLGLPNPSGATFETVAVQGDGRLVMAPGWYNTVTVSSGAPVTMKPGLYLINSSYDQSGSGDLTSGSGVNGVSIIVGHKFEATGTGTVTLSCCASQMQNNIVIYHTGNTLPGSPWTATGSNVINLMGNNSTRNITGNIYSPLGAPCATPCVQIGGNGGSMTINGQVAAPTVEVNGTGITLTFTGDSGSEIPRPYLAE